MNHTLGRRLVKLLGSQVVFGLQLIRGAAFYSDEYVKIDGQWRIKHTGYKRTYEEIQSRDGVPGLRLTADWFNTDGRSSLI